MKVVFLSVLIVLSSTLIHAQTRLSGVVSGNKKPLEGASVTITGTYDGATTDSAGKFEIMTSETGEFVVEVTATGYKPYEEKLLFDGKPHELVIELKALFTELSAVVLTAGTFEASDQKKGTMLNALDIVTTASAQGDVTGAIKTLPGAQQVGESEGLFVRGGTATESRIFIDGTSVNNFFYSSIPGIASRGRFNPFLFKGTVFSSGGYSALYGQALSSALILETKDLPERTEGSLAISVIGVGGGLQKLAKNKSSSWGFTYNYTNLWPAFKLIPQKQDFFNEPLYHDGDVNFRIKTKRGFIKYYGYGNWNKVGMRAPDIDSVQLNSAIRLQNKNIYQNLNWRENIGKGWKLFTAVSFSDNRDNINNELQDAGGSKILVTDPLGYAFKNFDLVSKNRFLQGRLVIEKKLRGLNSIRFGGDHFYNREKTYYTLFNGERFTTEVRDNLTAGFAEADIYITNNLAAKAGTRVEYSRLLEEVNIAPRLSLAYKMKNYGQLSFAYGIFYQNPENRYMAFATPGVSFTEATHYILQFQKVAAKRSFRSEVFYKKYNDLLKTFPDNNGRTIAGNNTGYGHARGIEFFWRDKASFKNLDYWISYSYLDTKRDFLNYPFAIQPSFATEHTASLVMKKFVLPWKTGFNASYTFATGRPYYQFSYDETEQKYNILQSGKTIPYNNLGFSVNYLPKIGKKDAKTFMVWVLSISNVLGQKQVFTYNFATLSNRKEEVTPPSRRFVYIGCFLSFGVDRTEEAINNNL